MTDIEKLWSALRTLEKTVSSNSRRLDSLDGGMVAIEEPPPMIPVYLSGELELSELDLAAIFLHARATFNLIDGGGLKAAAEAIAATIAEVGVNVKEPWSGFFFNAATTIVESTKDLNAGFMSDLGWTAFFERMAATGYQYEHEEGRESKLTAGEFFSTIGIAIHEHLKPGSYLYTSSRKPTGLKQPETVGSIFGQICGVVWSLGRWFGNWRQPIVPRGEVEPVNLDGLPYSIPGGR